MPRPMISLRELSRSYTRMLKNISNEDKVRGINQYFCMNPDCGKLTTTEDIHVGTTPMQIACPHCTKGMAMSKYYQDIPANSKVEYIWYRPTWDQILNMRRKGSEDLYHVLAGGLIKKPVK